MQPQEFLPAIEAVAREAGEILRAGYAATREVRFKGAIDLVTQYDTASEALILKRLRAAYPDHDVHAEESGVSGSTAPYLWFIDPLDGTTNFAHRFPFFAVSIALCERRPAIRPIAGVVYDPLHAELFAAAAGAGATLNGEPLQVSTTPALDQSLIATGFPYDVRTVGAPGNNLAYFQHMQLRAQGIRRAGAASLDLAYVAAGRLDGYWEQGLNPWDAVAGILLVREAGGRVTGLQGEPVDYARVAIIATNGLIHDDVQAELASANGAPG